MDGTRPAGKWLLVLGSLGPIGHLPASGTIAVAVVGIPLFWLLHRLPDGLYVAITVAFTLAAVWLHDRGDRLLGEKDSRKLVWDELAGFLVATMFLPFTWPVAIAAFVLERTLDIIKAPPARWIERHVAGGWGVVGDDIVAGAYTCVAMHIAIRVAQDW